MRNGREDQWQSPTQRFVRVVGEVLGIILLVNGIDGIGTLSTDTAARWGNIGAGSFLLILSTYQFLKYLRKRRRSL